MYHAILRHLTVLDPYIFEGFVYLKYNGVLDNELSIRRAGLRTPGVNSYIRLLFEIWGWKAMWMSSNCVGYGRSGNVWLWRHLRGINWRSAHARVRGQSIGLDPPTREEGSFLERSNLWSAGFKASGKVWHPHGNPLHRLHFKSLSSWFKLQRPF